MVNVQTGAYDKQSAEISKGYHKTRAGKFLHYNPLKSRSSAERSVQQSRCMS